MRISKPRALASLLALLVLVVPGSVSAAGGITRGVDAGTAVEPTGVGVCDLKLSTSDTPPTDDTITVAIGEEIAVVGSGYPPTTQIVISYVDRSTGEKFDEDRITTDAAGEFGYFIYWLAGSEGALRIEARDPASVSCQDLVNVNVVTGHPFTDIGGHLFESEIAWLYQGRITTGCTSSRFCPDASVTRGQMASFLVRALDLPPTSTDFFTDDETSIHEADINRLAASGITTGCTATRFCPTAGVTRQQMASFLVRGLGLSATSTDFFTDDETSIHEADINRLAASGITGGCGGTRFCPTQSVTRGQMAAFLERALF